MERNSQTILQFDITVSVGTAYCPPTPTAVSLSVLSLQKGPCVPQDNVLYKFSDNTVLANVISLKRTTLPAHFKHLDLSTTAIFGDEFKF